MDDTTKNELLELCINNLTDDDIIYILCEQMRRNGTNELDFKYDCNVDGSYWTGYIQNVNLIKY